MMDILSQATGNIQRRRFFAEEKTRVILDILMEKQDFKQNDTEIRQQILVVARLEYQGKDTVEANKILARLKDNEKIIAQKYDISADELTPQYSCKICNDSGYNDSKQCKCLKKEIRRLITSSVLSFDPQFTFDNSSDKGKIYNLAQQYCEKFPNTKFKNILLCGKTGTGKTYLCCCIANALIEREFSLTFISAFELQLLFLKEHIADAVEKNLYLQSLIDVEVLIIDDLGTEPILKNVTEEYLYTLVNERNRQNKATVISTNLSLSDIKQHYGERIFVRLLDKTRTLVHEMTGADKRL